MVAWAKASGHSSRWIGSQSFSNSTHIRCARGAEEKQVGRGAADRPLSFGAEFPLKIAVTCPCADEPVELSRRHRMPSRAAWRRLAAVMPSAVRRAARWPRRSASAEWVRSGQQAPPTTWDRIRPR